MIETTIGYIVNETHDVITGVVYHGKTYSPRLLPLGLGYEVIEGIHDTYTMPAAIDVYAPAGCRITLTITGGPAIVTPGGAVERIWIRSDGCPYILDAQGNQRLLQYKYSVY